MASALRKITNVELMEVGMEWPGMNGNVTFTREHLAATLAAFDDPAIPAPIVKLGHTSTLAGDAEPALGRLVNPHLSEDGMTLLADLDGVPAWLADAMPTMYPRRSIEGKFNFATLDGRTHDFALSALALLGARYPAIMTLKDLELLATAESADDLEWVDATAALEKAPEGIEKGPAMSLFKKKRAEKVALATAVDDVRRAFNEKFRHETIWMRELHVDPQQVIATDWEDETTWRIDYSIANDEVTFSDPVEVKVVYQEASQVAASHSAAVVRYSTREESNTALIEIGSDDSLTNTEVHLMNADQLKAFGLEEGATEDEINAKLIAAAEALTKVQSSDTPPEGGNEPAAPGSPPVTIPQQKADEANVVIPDGFELVSAAQRQADAEEFAKMKNFMKKTELAERDEFIAASMREGKFAPSDRDAMLSAWDEDAERTRRLIEKLPKGLVALANEEIGHGGTGEDEVELSYSTAGMTPAEIKRITFLKSQTQEA